MSYLSLQPDNLDNCDKSNLTDRICESENSSTPDSILTNSEIYNAINDLRSYYLKFELTQGEYLTTELLHHYFKGYNPENETLHQREIRSLAKIVKFSGYLITKPNDKKSTEIIKSSISEIIDNLKPDDLKNIGITTATHFLIGINKSGFNPNNQRVRECANNICDELEKTIQKRPEDSIKLKEAYIIIYQILSLRLNKNDSRITRLISTLLSKTELKDHQDSPNFLYIHNLITKLKIIGYSKYDIFISRLFRENGPALCELIDKTPNPGILIEILSNLAELEFNQSDIPEIINTLITSIIKNLNLQSIDLICKFLHKLARLRIDKNQFIQIYKKLDCENMNFDAIKNPEKINSIAIALSSYNIPLPQKLRSLLIKYHPQNNNLIVSPMEEEIVSKIKTLNLPKNSLMQQFSLDHVTEVDIVIIFTEPPYKNIKIAIECDGDKYHYTSGNLKNKSWLKDRIIENCGIEHLIRIPELEYIQAPNKEAYLEQKIKECLNS